MKDFLPREFSLENLRILTEEGRYEDAELMAYGFLNDRFKDSKSRSGEYEYLSEFYQQILTKWREEKDSGRQRWKHIQQRCSTTAAAKSYLFKSFVNFAHKKINLAKHPEKYAQRKRIRELIQKTESFHQIAAMSGRGQVAAYGLKQWGNESNPIDLFSGNIEEPSIAKRCSDRPPFQTTKQKYKKEDLILGCEWFLQAVEKYARAYIISDAVQAYWAPCANFGTLSFFEIDERDEPEQPENQSIFKEEAYEMIKDFVNQLNSGQQAVLREYSVHQLANEAVCSKEVGKKLGCSHATVCNRHKEIRSQLQTLLETLKEDDRLLICRFLLHFFETSKKGSLSPNEPSIKGESQ